MEERKDPKMTLKDPWRKWIGARVQTQQWPRIRAKFTAPLKNPSSSTSENMAFLVSSLLALQSLIHSWVYAYMHAANMN